MEYILGVDGGGTKTIIRIADIYGNIIAERITGPSNYKKVELEVAASNIIGGVFETIKDLKLENPIINFKSSCFGLAGLDSKKDEDIYKELIFNSALTPILDLKKTLICNDSRIGLAAGTDKKNGIMIICGTGSNCFGINEDGTEVKADGWDFILGDECSGYEVGLRALRAVMRDYDKRGKETILKQHILKKLNLENIEDLIEWAYIDTFFCEKIAALAQNVCDCANLGDKVSIKILSNAVNEAYIAITTVATQLGFKNKDFDIVFVGSLFRCEKYFKDLLCDKLKKVFDGINFIKLNDKPVAGAVKLALSLL
ncbi:MAG: BadF/BadG/BcrA/BcrD ATPase family protein [Actinomycetota bacterium]|nr:BadF/BadG/BcrA/BcrD ATPase family protein [Actinomycetota bacterium]